MPSRSSILYGRETALQAVSTGYVSYNSPMKSRQVRWGVGSPAPSADAFPGPGTGWPQ
jgi:hypothetical protein